MRYIFIVLIDYVCFIPAPTAAERRPNTNVPKVHIQLCCVTSLMLHASKLHCALLRGI